jgi:hypothetical protein
VGPAATNDRALADTLFAQRETASPALLSAGESATAVSLADSGFAGVACEAHWVAEHHAQVVAPPQTGSTHAWSRPQRRWVAGRRQIVETVIGRLEAPFRLERERPHELGGFLAWLAAKMAVHTLCLWLNRRLGHPPLALGDLFGW